MLTGYTIDSDFGAFEADAFSYNVITYEKHDNCCVDVNLISQSHVALCLQGSNHHYMRDGTPGLESQRGSHRLHLGEEALGLPI